MVSNGGMFFRPRIAAHCVLWLSLQLTLVTAPLAAAESVIGALDSPFFAVFDGNLAQAFKAAKADDKRILLFFGATDCRYCQFMKQHILNDPAVLQFYRQHYVAYALDIRDPRPIRDETGQEMSMEAYARSLRVRLTPTLIYFDRDGESLFRQTGYIIDPKDFIELGRSLIENSEQP